MFYCCNFNVKITCKQKQNFFDFAEEIYRCKIQVKRKPENCSHNKTTEA